MIRDPDDRNPESRLDAALNLIASRRRDPTAFRPPAPSTGGKGWLDVLGGLLHTSMFGGVRQPGLPFGDMVPQSAGSHAAHPGKGMNLLESFEWAGREGIREPITTALTVGTSMPWGTKTDDESVWDVVKRLPWKESYAIAQDRSMGQAAMLGLQEALGKVGIGSGGDITDPDSLADMQARQLYRKGSGVVDALGRIFIDPAAIVGGKMLGAGAKEGASVVSEAAETGQGLLGRWFRNRGMETPGRWIGKVDAPDYVPPNPTGVLPGYRWVNPTEATNFSRYPPIRTDAYLDDIRSARAPVQPVTHQVPAPGAPASVLDLPPGMEMPMVRAPRPVQGGVFKGTAAEGKTLPEIGDMVARSTTHELSGGVTARVMPVGEEALPMLTGTEMAQIWPTVSRMYADDIVDSIINSRRGRDTIRLRAIFDHPQIATGRVSQDWASARDSLLHLSQRSFSRMGDDIPEVGFFGTDNSGLRAWFNTPHPRLGFPDASNAARIEQVRRLVAADLKEITRRWVDEAGLPERVSVARAQMPGEAIGPSAYTNPLAARWWDEAGEQVSMPGVGGSTREVFESSVDPRKDIDWFMNARKGSDFGEDEVLVSAKTLAENIVQGMPEGAAQGVAAAVMPGIARTQMEFGPGARPLMIRLLEEMKRIDADPEAVNLIQRLIREPAGKGREALVEQVHRATDQARRNLLESQGWTDLPRVAATGARDTVAGRLAGEQQSATVTLRRLAAGEYAPKDWLRMGMDDGGMMGRASGGGSPLPPGWIDFKKYALELVEDELILSGYSQELVGSQLRYFLKSLADDLTLYDDTDLAGWLANQETRAPLGWRNENLFGSWWDEGVSHRPGLLHRERSPIVDTWIQRLVGWETRGAAEQPQMVLKANWRETMKEALRNWIDEPGLREHLTELSREISEGLPVAGG